MARKKKIEAATHEQIARSAQIGYTAMREELLMEGARDMQSWEFLLERTRQAYLARAEAVLSGSAKHEAAYETFDKVAAAVKED